MFVKITIRFEILQALSGSINKNVPDTSLEQEYSTRKLW